VGLRRPGPRRISRARAGCTRERLAWSEDERAIYFIGESRGQRGVWRIGVDATAHRVVAGPTRIFSAQGNAHTFALSRDGRHIAFGATRPAQLWAYDLDDAGRLRRESATPVSREAVYAESPALSPDGGQLVSLQTQPGSRQQTNLVLRDMTGGANSERILRTIDDIHENIGFPRWNAAGTRLSYGDYFSDTNTIRDQVRLLDPATRRAADALTSPQPASSLIANLPGNWTPDDRAVVASSPRYVEGRDSIVLLPLDKAPHAELSPIIVTSTGQGRIFQVMVSPDGRWIVFRATLSGRPQLAIVSTSARGSDEASWVTAVARTGWKVDKPRWSPSGDRIYFSVTTGGPLSLWSIGFDTARGQVGGEPRSELIPTSPAFHLLPDIREFDLAVGGRRLVVPIVRPTGGIWISERVR
jgi:Tol biopolymer transport system component